MKKALFCLIFLATPAGAQDHFCPEPDVPYTFTVYEDLLLINRMNHRAFCTHIDGTEYECIEKWIADEVPSVYTVNAKILGNGVLSFQPPKSEGDPMLIARCQ